MAHKKIKILCPKCKEVLMIIYGHHYVDIPKDGMFLESYIRCHSCKATFQYDILNKLQGAILGEEIEEKMHIEF